MRSSLLLTGLLLAANANAQAPAKPGDVYRTHAMQLAGTDLKAYANKLCNGAVDSDAVMQTQIPPTRVFDDLIFLGYGRWNSWALTTSHGIILFDSLEDDAEAQKYIIDGLTRIDVDPAQIKYVVVTHGHGDHYGGARLIHEKFGARILMSDADWNLVANNPVRAGTKTRKPDRDLTIEDGQTVTLGDTSVKLYLTPGHTSGTVSAIFPIHDKGERHIVAYWGGTAILPGISATVAASSGAPAATGMSPVDQYLASVQKFGPLAREAGVDVFVSNHPTNDVTLIRLPLLATRKSGGPHPFVIGANTYARSLDVLENCVRAVKADQRGP